MVDQLKTKLVTRAVQIGSVEISYFPSKFRVNEIQWQLTLYNKYNDMLHPSRNLQDDLNSQFPQS